MPLLSNAQWGSLRFIIVLLVCCFWSIKNNFTYIVWTKNCIYHFFKSFLLQSKPVNLSAETKYYRGGGPQIIKQCGFFQPKHKSTSRTPCILKLRGSVYLKLNPRVTLYKYTMFKKKKISFKYSSSRVWTHVLIA